MRYPALIDGATGAYGVTFPDIPGVGAMGDTIDAALVNAAEALHDYGVETARDGAALAAPSAMEVIEVPAGSALTSVLLVPVAPKSETVRVNMALSADVLEVITTEAQRMGLSRKDYVEWLVRCMGRSVT